MRLEGIEPPSQEPESHVISITLQALNNINYIKQYSSKRQGLIEKFMLFIESVRYISESC